MHGLACIIGRRGGKSRAIATLACCIAGLCDHGDALVPGERGIVLSIAPNQKQAKISLVELRDGLNERGTKPVIPNRSNRKQPYSFSKRLYKLRWRIESAFNRLKDFRRIATRYDRLARNYLASVCLAATLVWWI